MDAKRDKLAYSGGGETKGGGDYSSGHVYAV